MQASCYTSAIRKLKNGPVRFSSGSEMDNKGGITYFSFVFYYEKPNVDRMRLQIHSNRASPQSLLRSIARDMYVSYVLRTLKSNGRYVH